MNLFDAIFSDRPLSDIAVLYEQRHISYRELRDQTLRLAEVLDCLDLPVGDRVAILLQDSPEFIASFIFVCSVGAIAVPINMALRVDEQRAILNDCTASVAFIESELCNSLLSDAPERLRHLKEVLVVSRGRNDEYFRVDTQKTQQDRGEVPRMRSVSDLLKQTEGKPAFMSRSTVEESPAFILYTSGSTGEPKGAVHRQSDIFYTNKTFCREVLRLLPGDRLFSSSRLPFAYGLGNSFSFPLLNGVTTVLCRERPTG